MTDEAGKTRRTAPRRLKGFRDLTAGEVLARERMIDTIRRVYQRYGFSPLETPALEYVDVLGKFLPESDRPDGGIFALRNEDDDWIALRYDLTAPLSRFVAANLNDLPLPFRRYQLGPVYRLEKPGPGRYREFYQFDFDTVGTASMLADAESCMIMADTLEALGIVPGDYVVRLNNRKVLDGVLQCVAGGADLPPGTALAVLRQIDKLERLGLAGVEQMLGQGRRDRSGAFNKGVGLAQDQTRLLMDYLSIRCDDRSGLCDALDKLVADAPVGREGVDELRQIDSALTAAGYASDRISIDPTVVRGLAYYTGPVFEAVLTVVRADESAGSSKTDGASGTGATGSLGSVFGGGRYDDLVARFIGRKLPATGASLGVDRLVDALRTLGKLDDAAATAPVLVTRLDKKLTSEYQRMAAELRAAGIGAELYVGNQNIGKQFKYAADTGKAVAIVMGSNELERREVAVKDLRLGEELARDIGPDRARWLKDQPAQYNVARALLAEAVEHILQRRPGRPPESR